MFQTRLVYFSINLPNLLNIFFNENEIWLLRAAEKFQIENLGIKAVLLALAVRGYGRYKCIDSSWKFQLCAILPKSFHASFGFGFRMHVSKDLSWSQSIHNIISFDFSKYLLSFCYQFLNQKSALSFYIQHNKSQGIIVLYKFRMPRLASNIHNIFYV